MLLIFIGLWLVLRPRMSGPDTAVTQKLIGNIQRSGAWAVTNEEFNLLVGDVDLDFRNAQIPLGENHPAVCRFCRRYHPENAQRMSVSASLVLPLLVK